MNPIFRDILQAHGIDPRSHEEEQKKVAFCAECGTEIPSGDLCFGCAVEAPDRADPEDEHA